MLAYAIPGPERGLPSQTLGTLEGADPVRSQHTSPAQCLATGLRSTVGTEQPKRAIGLAPCPATHKLCGPGKSIRLSEPPCPQQ